MQGKQLNQHKNLALRRKLIYKFERYCQLEFVDFNQPAGLKMNLENRWIKKDEIIPWDAIEEKYAKLFPRKTGMPAKPPFVPSLFVEFRKRMKEDILGEINEMVIAYNTADDPRFPPDSGRSTTTTETTSMSFRKQSAG